MKARLFRSRRAYMSLAVRNMQNALAYRLTYIMGFIANFIVLIAMYALWSTIYEGRDELAGMTWMQMKTYLLVAFICNAAITFYSETRISGKILDGSVSIDLLKPLDFQKARFAETLGSTVIEGGLTAVIVIIVLLFTSGFLKPDFAHAVLFILSLGASLFVKFGIVYLAGLLCFWTTGAVGIVWARMAVTSLFSGSLVPLAFFPGWLEKLSLAMPFQGIVHTPAAIYMQQLTMTEALGAFAAQCAWAVALWYAGKLVWSRAVRQITIHGG
ncbi:ABC transporter permease [Paenibacillus kobensis]|uniref:ABC transporter permease n=1 Tax=Paenibacillus kobensis TaxID=59841 RepID=UPI000FD7015B|nr:ABC-2 family transporter protein [Paenibacillus kobensis]